MSNQWAYRILLGALGVAASVFGLVLTVSFFVYQRPFSNPGIPTGPVGYYFVAFTGCALMGWGGGLIGACRSPESSRTVSTYTVWVLCFMAVVRMTAWFVGDYALWLGNLPRIEAGLFLLIALALVWLRPESGHHKAAREAAAAKASADGVATATGEAT